MSASAAATMVLSRKVTNNTSDSTASASRGRVVPGTGPTTPATYPPGARIQRYPPPTLPPGASPTPRPAFLAGPGRGQLHPAPADQARDGGGRHQGVPLPRPGPPDHRGGVDVGPQHGAGHGDAPEHRLPVPDGALLHAGALAGHPGVGRSAPLDGLAADGGRTRRGLLRPPDRPG